MSNDDAKRIVMKLEGMADCFVEQWAGDIGYARVMREELTALLRHVRAETLREAADTVACMVIPDRTIRELKRMAEAAEKGET